jgi:hypothetical protein
MFPTSKTKPCPFKRFTLRDYMWCSWMQFLKIRRASGFKAPCLFRAARAAVMSMRNSAGRCERVAQPLSPSSSSLPGCSTVRLLGIFSASDLRPESSTRTDAEQMPMSRHPDAWENSDSFPRVCWSAWHGSIVHLAGIFSASPQNIAVQARDPGSFLRGTLPLHPSPGANVVPVVVSYHTHCTHFHTVFILFTSLWGSKGLYQASQARLTDSGPLCSPQREGA